MSEYNGYSIRPLGTFPMVEIKALGQGFVPGPLKGLFTTRSEAMKAIDVFVRDKEKGPRDGKTKSARQG